MTAANEPEHQKNCFGIVAASDEMHLAMEATFCKGSFRSS